MQRFCASVGYFKSQGWEIEVWCNQCDDDIRSEVDKVVQIVKLPATLDKIFRMFSILASLKVLKYKLFNKQKAIFHGTIANAYGLDISSHNFSSVLWIKKFVKLKYKFARDWLKLPIMLTNCFWEFVEMKLFLPEIIIANSNGLQQYLEGKLKERKTQVVYVRNQIDSKIFSPQVRELYREEYRTKNNFEESDFVFSFLGQGHLARKGWYFVVLAIKACRDVVNSKHIKFYSIGLHKNVYAEAKKFLNKYVEDWEDWVIFVETNPDVEKHLSAADCFVFPSFFDSNANSANEAAAMGIPCIVGNYFGADLLAELDSVTMVPEVNEELLMKELLTHYHNRRRIDRFASALDLSRLTCEPDEWAAEISSCYSEMWTTKFGGEN